MPCPPCQTYKNKISFKTCLYHLLLTSCLQKGGLWHSMKWKWNMKFLIPWLLTTEATPGPYVIPPKEYVT